MLISVEIALRKVMQTETSVDVIVNAGAVTGYKADIPNHIREIFSARGVNARISLAGNAEELGALARRVAQSKNETIVAAGGDGTINSVAAAAQQAGKTLGVLPLGTFNHFAKDLHIPLDLEGAAQTIIEGHSTWVDTGEVNGHIFLNNSSLGLYPSMVSERKRHRRLGTGKWPAFLWASFTVLRRYPFMDVRLSTNGNQFVSRTPLVFVGNNEYEMEGLNIGARASLKAGKLSLYVTHRMGRLGLIRLALRALLGGLSKEKDFVALSTEEIWLETRHRHLRVALDGEVTVLRPPLHYRVRPLSLQVLVPQEEFTAETLRH